MYRVAFRERYEHRKGISFVRQGAVGQAAERQVSSGRVRPWAGPVSSSVRMDIHRVGGCTGTGRISGWRWESPYKMENPGILARNYWWPQMSRYIGKYVSTCDLCLRTKAQRHFPVGELHPLPVPSKPWDTISADFIVELPESSGHDAIMVVVDSVVKKAHFIPTVTTITAAGTARLYVQNVWRRHRLPQKIVSDRGPQFVAEFTRELYRLLGIKLAATMAYHPQGDRQTE
jgi:Integrase zinc binding domain